MPFFATLPFTLRRSTDAFTISSMTTTTETVHGLLRLEGEDVTVQWRLFAADVELAIAERTLARADEARRLRSGWNEED